VPWRRLRSPLRWRSTLGSSIGPQLFRVEKHTAVCKVLFVPLGLTLPFCQTHDRDRSLPSLGVSGGIEGSPREGRRVICGQGLGENKIPDRCFTCGSLRVARLCTDSEGSCPGSSRDSEPCGRPRQDCPCQPWAYLPLRSYPRREASVQSPWRGPYRMDSTPWSAARLSSHKTNAAHRYFKYSLLHAQPRDSFTGCRLCLAGWPCCPADKRPGFAGRLTTTVPRSPKIQRPQSS
jgi:hypothetical protein